MIHHIIMYRIKYDFQKISFPILQTKAASHDKVFELHPTACRVICTERSNRIPGRWWSQITFNVLQLASKSPKQFLAHFTVHQAFYLQLLHELVVFPAQLTVTAKLWPAALHAKLPRPR